MKVIGINGSGRKDGNTALLMRTVFAELAQQGIDTELIQLADYPIHGCTACWACHHADDHRCVMTDDAFQYCFEQLLAADGILLASPVYSADVTAQMKALLDRASAVLSANKGLFRHKVGAAITAARRAGGMHAFDTMMHFLHSKEMILVGSSYWNMGYGMDIGAVEQDQEGMANMRNLGQNMAWLLQKLHGGA